MSENIFADSPREGETLEEILSPVEKDLQDNPTESQTEKEIEKLELPDEEKLAIQKRNSAFEEAREAREQAEQKARELEERLNALEKDKQPIEQPEFLTEMVGKNEEVTKKWYQEREQIKEEVKQELIQAQAEAQRKETETRAYWDRWVYRQLDEVGAKDENIRNELRKVMTEYTPTDEQGNLDFKKGMKLLNDLKKAQAQAEEQKVQAKKNVADATVSKETGNKERKNFLTRNDLRNGWRGIVNKDD